MSSEAAFNEKAARDRASLAEALAQLRLKLLDLSGRNRLLNFKHTPGRSLQFVEGQPAKIYQRLIDAPNRATVTIMGLPEAPEAEWVERNGRKSRPDPREWARRCGVSTGYDLDASPPGDNGSRVRALLYPDDLAKHSRKLEREAISAIEETGANMLFLVLGFLEFPDQRNSERTFIAPLVSIPVVLSKGDIAGNQIFSLQYTGDDVSENLSLREKMRVDHGIIVPDLDDDQIDIEGYFHALQRIIETRPGFRVRRWTSLCILSFANMLLVRDLDPSKWPQSGDQNGLLDHRIIREVFEGRPQQSDRPTDGAIEYDVEEGPAEKISLVFDADSSQHRALADVLVHRRNLVIEGPPGTGKSQTITNLIAAGIAEGKKVLFVAEKLAALEVVRNRLERAGLEPFVLELHSNKSSKKRVLEELSKRIEYRGNPPIDLPRKLLQLEGHRRDLKFYNDLINSVCHNSLGITLHKLMWRAESFRLHLSANERLLSQLSVSDATEISEYELSRRVDCLGHLSDQFAEIGGFSVGSVFWGFFPDRIIPGDEVRLREFFIDWAISADSLAAHAAYYANLKGESPVRLTPEDAGAQLRTLAALLGAAQSCDSLHLLPRLFAGDPSGAKARKTLNGLATQLKWFAELGSAVTKGLRKESSGTAAQVVVLQRLDRAAKRVGAGLGTAEQIKSLCHVLRRESSRLSAALPVVTEYCARSGISFDGSRKGIDQLVRVTRVVMEAPQELFRVQQAGLMRDGCHKALVVLASMQQEWVSLQADLAEFLYIDMLPHEDEVKQSIMALRQYRSWHRVFRRRWRAAVSTHKRIHRDNRRLKPSERLSHLEEIAKLIKLRERWRTDPAWQQYLDISVPAEPIDLDDHITLAVWNESAREVLETVSASVFSLSDFTRDRMRVLQREFETLSFSVAIVSAAHEGILGVLLGLVGIDSGDSLAETLAETEAFASQLESQLNWLTTEVPSDADFSNSLWSCEAAVERERIRTTLNANRDAEMLLGDHFCGVETDLESALAALAFGQNVDTLPLPPPIRKKLLVGPLIETTQSFHTALEGLVVGFTDVAGLVQKLGEFGAFSLEIWVGRNPADDIVAFANALKAKTRLAAEAEGLLIPWSLYVARRKEALALGLELFVELLEAKRVEAAEIAPAYAYATHATIIRTAFRNIPQLGQFSGLKHNQIREEFSRLDRDVINIRGKDIASRCDRAASPPPGRNGTRVDDRTEMVLLNYLLPQQRPRMPVRKMLARAGHAVQALKPCFMMGPQAVAQYLTPGAISFDLVIMDEASQLKPEEAIGAIARGGQLVVVGDPKQLPPTSFFSRMSQAGDDDDQFTTTDAESILDVCSAQFYPPRHLRWHYRSQHHSLIAFSNQHFYRGNLIVFPSPYGQSSRLGVRATYLADAVYENQTNLREARRVVDAVAERITNCSDESVGVVTLNIKQRDLIAELLDERLRSVAGADAYRERWTEAGQPLFVKNLENVQGDERDAIVISTTFGKPSGSGAVRQNFGPISRQGGWRRLNVLFTRARKSVAIYTSLRPEDIVVDKATPEGTKALRNYLEYARTGSLAVAVDEGREPDSEFEVAVIGVLQARGFEVTPQLGVAGFRIDIAVKHPEAPGIYLAAIECDGASYHSAQSVRDRDRIRQEILESLGWRGRIWRIWSTDWFRTPREETEKLLSFLADTKRSWRPEHSSGEAWIEEGGEAMRGNPVSEQAEVLHAVSGALLETEDDIDVQAGDFVRYVDVLKPDDVLSVQIAYRTTDIGNGVVSVSTPLAQCLLGAVAGDEVSLHLPGTLQRVFRVVGIKRPVQRAAA